MKYDIFYYNENDKMYCYQHSFSTLSEAKENYNIVYKGYIKCGERICKRYAGYPQKNTLLRLEEADVERIEDSTEIRYNDESPVASDDNYGIQGDSDFEKYADEITDNELYRYFDGTGADMAAVKCGYTAYFDDGGARYYFK